MLDIINNTIKLQLVKGVYKIHKIDEYIQVPVIRDNILTYVKLKYKNKFYYTKFSKDFKISYEIFYLHTKIKEVFDKIFSVIKQKGKGVEPRQLYQVYDMYLLSHLLDTLPVIHKYDGLEAFKKGNLITLLGFKEVPIYYKSVNKEIKYFITKQDIFRNNKNIIGFYMYRPNVNIKGLVDNLFYSAEDYLFIKAKPLTYTDNLGNMHAIKLEVLDMEKTMKAIKQLRHFRLKLYNNLIMYFLIKDVMENTDKAIQLELLLKIFTGYDLYPQDAKIKLGFTRELKDKYSNPEALKEYILNYYTILLNEFGQFALTIK